MSIGSVADAERARLREVALEAALTSGRMLLERMDSIREVRTKQSAVDLVTDVDVASEKQVRATLLKAFPEHSIIGEEGGTVTGRDGRFRWFVDPLDGTTNYTHGFPFFCVSIGLEVDGQLTLGVVFSPTLNELFVAEAGRGATLNGRPIRVSSIADLRDGLLATGFPYNRAEFGKALKSFEVMSLHSQAVRRAGSAALDLCYVACGRLDGFWEHRLQPWDLAAGAVIVSEAGGTLTTTDGGPFTVESGQVLASNGAVHSAMAEALAGITY